jgi:hypothetical protein
MAQKASEIGMSAGQGAIEFTARLHRRLRRLHYFRPLYRK